MKNENKLNGTAAYQTEITALKNIIESLNDKLNLQEIKNKNLVNNNKSLQIQIALLKKVFFYFLIFIGLGCTKN